MHYLLMILLGISSGAIADDLAEINALLDDFVGHNLKAPLSQRDITDMEEGRSAYFEAILDCQPEAQCQVDGMVVKHADRWYLSRYSISPPLPELASFVEETPRVIKAVGPGAEVEEPEVEKRCRKKRHKTNVKADC